jgi:hypothetical protein
LRYDVPHIVITKHGRGRLSRLSIYEPLDDGMTELQRIGGLPEPDVASEIWHDIWYEETHNPTATRRSLISDRARRVWGPMIALRGGSPKGVIDHNAVETIAA